MARPAKARRRGQGTHKALGVGEGGIQEAPRLVRRGDVGYSLCCGFLRKERARPGKGV